MSAVAFILLFEASKSSLPGSGQHLYGISTEHGPKGHRVPQDEWEMCPTHSHYFGDAWMRGMRWTYDGNLGVLQFMSTPDAEEYFDILHYVENYGYPVSKVVHLSGGAFRSMEEPKPEHAQ